MRAEVRFIRQRRAKRPSSTRFSLKGPDRLRLWHFFEASEEARNKVRDGHGQVPQAYILPAVMSFCLRQRYLLTLYLSCLLGP